MTGTKSSFRFSKHKPRSLTFSQFLFTFAVKFRKKCLIDFVEFRIRLIELFMQLHYGVGGTLRASGKYREAQEYDWKTTGSAMTENFHLINIRLIACI